MLTANGCISLAELPIDADTSCDSMNCGDGMCILNEKAEAECTCDLNCPDNMVSQLSVRP